MRFLKSLSVLLASMLAIACSDGTAPQLQPEPDDPPLAEPVQLTPGTTVGSQRFPIGNTERGGQGEPVSGVGCLETIAYHRHAHLSLFVEGERVAIPAAVGITNPVMQDGFAFGPAGSCLYWAHTHDASGFIHIEPPSTDIIVTLGQFFDIWGHPLAADNVAGFRGPVFVYVDGVRFRGDPRTIPFTQHGHIALYVGTPLPPIPTYIFPAGY
ncbi:hypothetical protein BH23GEM3_BH23GEM3_07470 [soil metagenome]